MTSINVPTGRAVAIAALVGVLLLMASATARAEPPSTGRAGEGQCTAGERSCAFAAALDEWLAERDLDTLLAGWRTQGYICPGPEPDGIGGPFPLCDGAREGELRFGYPFGTETEGGVYSASGARQQIRRWLNDARRAASDDFGGGAFASYTMGCPTSACAANFALVFSGIYRDQGGPPFRVLVAFIVDGRPNVTNSRITSVVSLLLTDAREPMLAGGRVPAKQLPSALRRFNQFREFSR